jgi:hypothetical protein
MAYHYFMDRLTPGMYYRNVTYGALRPFVDIGCGIISMIGIENISSRAFPIPAPFAPGQRSPQW